MLTFAIQYRGVEQLVARRAHNPEAGGSSPSPATKQDISNEMSLFFYCNDSQNSIFGFQDIIDKNGW